MNNQKSTYFSEGILKERNSYVYKIYMNRFNELEDGELLDLLLYEDLNFYNFLHKDFKNYYILKESTNLVSILFNKN